MKKSQPVTKEEEKRIKDLEKLRKRLGARHGAGEYYKNERVSGRSAMDDDDLKSVLKLLALGEKTINLKEREFLFF